MSNRNNSSTTSGISTLGLLGIVFVTLKLTGYIDWSWWWVTAPFWAGAVLFVAILLVFLIILALAKYFQRRARLKRFGLR